MQTFLWTLISFQEGFILVYLTPVPGKLNYAEIMCLPAFPASEGNTAREGCPRQWTHSFLPYSQPEELVGVVSGRGGGVCVL